MNSIKAHASSQPTFRQESRGKHVEITILDKLSRFIIIDWRNESKRQGGCIPLKHVWEDMDLVGVGNFAIEEISFWLEKPVQVNGELTPIIRFRAFNPALKKVMRDIVVDRPPNVELYEHSRKLRRGVISKNPSLRRRMKSTYLLSVEKFDDRWNEIGVVLSQLKIGYDFAKVVHEKIIDSQVRDHAFPL